MDIIWRTSLTGAAIAGRTPSPSDPRTQRWCSHPMLAWTTRTRTTRTRTTRTKTTGQSKSYLRSHSKKRVISSSNSFLKKKPSANEWSCHCQSKEQQKNMQTHTPTHTRFPCSSKTHTASFSLLFIFALCIGPETHCRPQNLLLSRSGSRNRQTATCVGLVNCFSLFSFCNKGWQWSTDETGLLLSLYFCLHCACCYYPGQKKTAT